MRGQPQHRVLMREVIQTSRTGPDALRLYAATKGIGQAMEVVIKSRQRYRINLSEAESQALADAIYAYGEKRYQSGYDVARERAP